VFPYRLRIDLSAGRLGKKRNQQKANRPVKIGVAGYSISHVDRVSDPSEPSRPALDIHTKAAST
jgi:hypothetical protein